MADRLEVRLHDDQAGWISRGGRRERTGFGWADGYEPGPVTLTESSRAVRSPSPCSSATTTPTPRTSLSSASPAKASSPGSTTPSPASLLQEDPIDCNLALAINGSFDHRRISAAHLIREAGQWNVLPPGETEQIVTTTLADFAKALDHVPVPPGVPVAATAQLAWNIEPLQAGSEIGERPNGYWRRHFTSSSSTA
jgi:hypothetical protein